MHAVMTSYAYLGWVYSLYHAVLASRTAWHFNVFYSCRFSAKQSYVSYQETPFQPSSTLIQARWKAPAGTQREKLQKQLVWLGRRKLFYWKGYECITLILCAWDQADQNKILTMSYSLMLEIWISHLAITNCMGWLYQHCIFCGSLQEVHRCWQNILQKHDNTSIQQCVLHTQAS